MDPDGSGSGNVAQEEDEDSNETFHIYVLSFLYSLLAVVIVCHLVGRWEWRRRKLRRFKTHVPGDKSFKCKGMQQTLRNDFAAIRSISPDPRLILAGHDPKEFGGCKDGASIPTHWYRMKAVDAAAELVAKNLCVLRGELRPTRTLSLPDFLAHLLEYSIGVKGHQSVVERCSEMYSFARYKDGNFSQAEYELFNSLLQQIQHLLSPDHEDSDPHTSPPSSLPPTQDPRVSVLSGHEPLSLRMSHTSQDPLLSPSRESTQGHLPMATSPLVTMAAPPASRASTGSRSKKKPLEIELSPLVAHEGDVSSPGRGSYPSSGVRRDPRIPVYGSELGIGRERYSSPETPV